MAKRFIYAFDEIDQAIEAAGGKPKVVALLGSKGTNLALASRLDVQVPKGFTITTEACRDFFKQNPPSFAPGMWEETLVSLHKLEAATGKRFGDSEGPLIVSCRAGDEADIGGLMPAILNIGMNDETVVPLIALTNNPRFVWDCYRRLIHTYAAYVLGLGSERFEKELEAMMSAKGRQNESEVQGDEWRELVTTYKKIVESETGSEFPQDPFQQIRGALAGVMRSWSWEKARESRRELRVSDEGGTAVVIVEMVFGNTDDETMCGDVYSRNPETGEAKLTGKYMVNAQGPDLSQGHRKPEPIEKLQSANASVYAKLCEVVKQLEKHFKDMQHIGFVVTKGELWVVGAGYGKRTAAAAVKIASDLVADGTLTKEEAILMVKPYDVVTLLHPYVTQKELDSFASKKFAAGVRASPGAAVGQIYFSAERCKEMTNKGQEVIFVSCEARTEVFAIEADCAAVVTTDGGLSSHMAVAARQMGLPAVVGCSDLEYDKEARTVKCGDVVMKEGDWMSVDGSTGQIFTGKFNLHVPRLEDQTELMKVLGWADETRSAPGNRKSVNHGPTRGLQVWANADTEEDVKKAREFGCEGIGLVRTDHMFCAKDRRELMQNALLSDSAEERAQLMAKLGELQTKDYVQLFQALDKMPVVLRLLDMPASEFLPDIVEQVREVRTLKTKKKLNIAIDEKELEEKKARLKKSRQLSGANPMVGLRGARLGIYMPELLKMQFKTIVEAACIAKQKGVTVKPQILVPMTFNEKELALIKPLFEEIRDQIFQEKGTPCDIKFGTMLETPRSCLSCDEIAKYVDYVTFGTNDLTQMAFGYSRDDAESSFLEQYRQWGIFPCSPFRSIDTEGMGRLIVMAIEGARRSKPDLEIGICGEHGGDPLSIEFCHNIGISYISCSPYRVPIARLAAAQAAIRGKA